MGIKRDSLDAAFSDFIRWRDHWTCRRCQRPYSPPTNALHCAHIYTRANKGLRWHEDNAIALCHGCHAFFTGRPLVFAEWCLVTFGQTRMTRLKYLYYQTTKFSRSEKQLLQQEFRRKIAVLKKQSA